MLIIRVMNNTEELIVNNTEAEVYRNYLVLGLVKSSFLSTWVGNTFLVEDIHACVVIKQGSLTISLPCHDEEAVLLIVRDSR